MSIVRCHQKTISWNILGAYEAGFFSNTASTNKIRLYTGTMPSADDYDSNGQAFYDSDFVCEFSGFTPSHVFPSLAMNIGNPTTNSVSAAKSGTITWAAITGTAGRGSMLATVGDRSNTDVVIVEDLNAVQGQDVRFVRAIIVLQPTQVQEAE